MRRLITAWTRLRALFSGKALERDMEREMQAHLDLLTEEHRRSGMSGDDARLAARRRFGNVGSLKERGRDVRGAGLLGDLVRDFAYAIRTYRASPILAAVIILSLALGIGANTALFSVVDAAYLRKLPVPEPDELVGFRWRGVNWRPDDLRGSSSTTGDSDNPGVEITRSPDFSRAAFESFREDVTALDSVFAFAGRAGASVVVDGQSDSTTVQAVSGNYFAALGVGVTTGRPLTDADDLETAGAVTIISHGAWQRLFAGDPGAVGRTILLNGHPFTIAGVVTPGFHGTDGAGLAEFLIPVAFETEATGANIAADTWSIKIMGRLKPGFTLEQVRGKLEGAFLGVAAATAATRPAQDALQLEVLPASRREPGVGGGGVAPGSVEQVVLLLGGVFIVLLVVVCMNISNLLTARAAARRYEIGVRLAMGAGRLRLIRQLLTESVLLALAGGGGGVGFAYWGRDVLRATIGRDLDLEIDPGVLGFALTASIATGVLFGFLPAVQGTRGDVYPSVQAHARQRSRSRSGLTAALVTAQIVLSVVILSGAGMLVQTLGRLPGDDVGIDTANLMVFRVNVAPLDGDPARYGAMLDALRAAPGIAGLTSESGILISGSGNYTNGFQPLDPVQDPARPWGRVRLHWVGDDYFDVLGLPVTAGRRFGSADAEGAPPVAIITEGLARRLGGDAIGRVIGRSDGPRVEVVGVVEDIGAGNIGLDGTIFFPASQRRDGGLNSSFEVRTVGDPAAVVTAIRAGVASVDARLPVYDVMTADQLIEAKVGPVRRMALAWSLFGLLALVLTSIGLYGLLSYSVTRRTGEIGVRMALGARRIHIVRSVVGRMLLLVLFGLGLGLAASGIVDVALRALVYGARVYDPASVAAVAIVLLGVTGIAGYLPARRASRTDPTVTLRCE